MTENVEFLFGIEGEANFKRRQFIEMGYAVSLIGYDSNVNVYAFDVYAPMLKSTRKDRHAFWRSYLGSLIRTGVSLTDGESEPISLDSLADDDDILALLTPKQVAMMARDCLAFIATIEENINAIEWEDYAEPFYDPWEQAGHDFALTRNGHGTGFWDRGARSVGEKLTDWSRQFGEQSFYGWHDADGTLLGIEIC